MRARQSPCDAACPKMSAEPRRSRSGGRAGFLGASPRSGWTVTSASTPRAMRRPPPRPAPRSSTTCCNLLVDGAEGDRRAGRAPDRLRRGAGDDSGDRRRPMRRPSPSWRMSTRRRSSPAPASGRSSTATTQGGDIVLPDDPRDGALAGAASLSGNQGRRRHRHRQRDDAAGRRRQGRRGDHHDDGAPPDEQPRHPARADPDLLHAGRGDRPRRPSPTCPTTSAPTFAYTLDGAELGEIVYETFSADKAVVTIQGVSIHPGWAKDKLVNALHLAAKIVDTLPQVTLTPETTDGRQGFIHLYQMSGTAAAAEAAVHPARLRARRAARPRRSARGRSAPRSRRPSRVRRSPARSRRSTATCATGWSTTCARSSWRARPAGGSASSRSPRPSAAAPTARA